MEKSNMEESNRQDNVPAEFREDTVKREASDVNQFKGDVGTDESKPEQQEAEPWKSYIDEKMDAFSKQFESLSNQFSQVQQYFSKFQDVFSPSQPDEIEPSNIIDEIIAERIHQIEYARKIEENVNRLVDEFKKGEYQEYTKELDEILTRHGWHADNIVYMTPEMLRDYLAMAKYLRQERASSPPGVMVDKQKERIDLSMMTPAQQEVYKSLISQGHKITPEEFLSQFK